MKIKKGFTMLKKLATALTLLGLSSAVHAELLSISYIDTNNESVTNDSSTKAINPDSNITFTLSGGIGRTVGIQVLQGGTIVSSTNSSVITVKDTINSGGNNYYGRSVVVPKPADGNYTVKAFINDIEGNVVNVDAYTIAVDTVAPTSTGELLYRQTAYAAYNNYDISSNILYFQLTNNDGGITKAEVIAKKDGDSEFRRTNASVESNQDISIKTYPRSIFNGDGKYQFGFALYDDAGNRTEVTKEYNVDNSYPDISWSHVYNPKTSNWDDYTPGMTVYANPASFRLKLAKTSHRDFSPNGTGIMNGYNSTDADNVYYELNVYKPASYTYAVLYTEAGMRRTYHQSNVSFNLGEGVDLSPQSGGYVDYKTSDGIWHDTHSTTISQPTTITEVRVHAKVRSYEQLAIFSGNSCVIPVGSTYCEVVANITRDSGFGYTPVATFLQSSVNGVHDGRFSVHTYYLLVHWDMVKSVFDKIETDGKKVKFFVTDHSKPNDWTNTKWATNYFALIATNKGTNAVTELLSNNVILTTFNTYTADFDLSSLPEATYSITAVLRDTYGNETIQVYDNNYTIDNTGPTIDVTYEGSALTGVINGLEGVSAKLTDPAEPKMVSIQLVGGPANSTVNLAWRSLSANTYGLEYPKIFPSLVAGEEYTITFTYSDSYSNTSDKSYVFSYIPTDLIEMDKIETFAVSRVLLTPEDKPITYITSPELIGDNGELARGDQSLDITLRGDSDFAVNIQGVRVEPGETKQFTVNVTNTNGKLQIPVYPAEANIVGKTSFMVTLPLIESIYCLADYEYSVEKGNCSIINTIDPTWNCPDSSRECEGSSPQCPNGYSFNSSYKHCEQIISSPIIN